MADITAAVEQEAVADSLLGDPQATETTDNATAGTEAAGRLQEGALPEQQDAQTEESAEDWLPTEQDRTFSDEALLRYAERYQKDAQWLSDPLNRQLLTDKLNSDIYLRQQQEQQQFQVEQPEQEQQNLDTRIPTIEEHLASLNQFSEQITDPRISQAFADSFLKAFGVTEAAKPETAKALATTMSTFGLNLIQSALPQILPNMLDSVMPGFSEMFYQATLGSSWDTVRNSSPAFAELPAFGSKEFNTLCHKLATDFPALTEMGWALEEKDGGRMNPESAQKFYGALVNLATRQQADPQLLQQAAQAGARTARRGEVRRSAGNLGAGQSKGAISQPSGASKFQTNSDLFDEEAMGIWQREHGKM